MADAQIRIKIKELIPPCVVLLGLDCRTSTGTKKRKRKEFLFHFFFLQFLCHFLVFDRHARMRHKVLVFDHMAVTLRVRQGNENRYARQQAIK